MSVENEPDPHAGDGARRAGFHMPKMNVAETRQKAEFILSRAWGLARNPRAEWEQIRDEDTNVPSILAGFVAPLAAIIPVCSLLGSSVFGERIGTEVVRTNFGSTLVGAVVTFVSIIALIYLIGVLINMVAENFDADRNELAAQKVAAYSMTPFLISGVFWLWPPLWWATLIGVGMTAFLLYRGLPPLMKVEPERAQGYTVTVMVAGLIAFIILFALGGCVTRIDVL